MAFVPDLIPRYAETQPGNMQKGAAAAAASPWTAWRDKAHEALRCFVMGQFSNSLVAEEGRKTFAHLACFKMPPQDKD